MASSPNWIRFRIALILAFLAFPLCADGVRAQGKPRIEIVPMLGHSALVTSVAFSPDGARVLSGSGDTTIKLWDAATGALIRTFEGHSAWVHSVAFSRDGTRVLSGSGDGTVRIWNRETGQLLESLFATRHSE